MVKCLFGKIVHKLLSELVLSIAYSFRIHVGISSGPTDLPGFNSCKIFTIPYVVNSMLAMLGYLAKPIGGVSLLFSLVKTE